MATKSQLKQYFETGKIPTQAQFGELIDSIFNIINSSDGSIKINSDENNIKLSINNCRILHGLYTSQISVSLYLFFNNDIRSNTKSVPVFIIFSTINSLNTTAQGSIKYAVPNITILKAMTDDKLDYLTADLETIIRKFNDLKITYYDLIPKDEVKKPSVVTIQYFDFDNTHYIHNYIMGISANNFPIPICIQSLIKLQDVENNNYSGHMSVLRNTVSNDIILEYEWDKITQLRGYEEGVIFDDTGIAESFMNTVKPVCYKDVPWK